MTSSKFYLYLKCHEVPVANDVMDKVSIKIAHAKCNKQFRARNYSST